MVSSSGNKPTNARDAAALALSEAAQAMPDIGAIEVPTAGLPEREAAMARDVYRLGITRWLTCAHLLNLFAMPQLDRLDPPMQGVLVAAVAQLLFRPDLPSYAVISEAVESARRLVHPKAAGLPNAVLRRVSELIGGHEPQAKWHPAQDMIPWWPTVLGEGESPEDRAVGVVRLREPVLPEASSHPGYSAVATGVPNRLLASWTEAFSRREAILLAVHAASHAPVFLQPGNVLWDAAEQPSDLTSYLAEHPEVRVQDPTAALPLEVLAEMVEVPPSVVFDACAGRGTKARQMRQLFPDAEVWAYDPDERHRRDLAQIPGVQVGSPAAGAADLVLFDVPCSNTGVIARRPEARHRYSGAHVNELIALQRKVVGEHLPAASSDAVLIYATCSIQPDENTPQAQWLAEASSREIVHEQLTLPEGAGRSYHDGGYFAVLGPLR